MSEAKKGANKETFLIIKTVFQLSTLYLIKLIHKIKTILKNFIEMYWRNNSIKTNIFELIPSCRAYTIQYFNKPSSLLDIQHEIKKYENFTLQFVYHYQITNTKISFRKV